MMKILLPTSVSSVQDIGALSIEIREYAKWFSHNAIKERVHAKNATPPPALSAGALDIIKSATGKKLLEAHHLDELVQTLDAMKQTSPTITVTLAAPPTGAIKQTLVEACRTYIADNALVTFKFNSGLLGGIVISHGSRVYDWSFRRQILANRSKFAEALKSV